MLATFVHDPGVEALADRGRVLDRTAVKAVALRDREVLLLRARSGAVKFPGGGVEPGESHEQALRRELDEECGVPLMAVEGELCRTVQLARPQEPGYDVFRMTSHYLACAVGDLSGAQRLEPYEADLGLTPVWLDVSAAAATCAALVGTGSAPPRWLQREIVVLRFLEEQLG